MPHAVLCGEFLLHAPCCFMWGVSLTHSFSFICGEILVHAPCCFMGEILLHGPYYFIWGVSFTWPMLFYGGISLTHSVLFYVGGSLTLLVLILCRKFVFHALCYLISGNGVTHPIHYVGRLSNSVQCVLSCEEFLLYSPYCFRWEMSLTNLRGVY